jgi:hypothetical protein
MDAASAKSVADFENEIQTGLRVLEAVPRLPAAHGRQGARHPRTRRRHVTAPNRSVVNRENRDDC